MYFLLLKNQTIASTESVFLLYAVNTQDTDS